MTEQIDALVTDRYLESLLLAAERRAYDAPADASFPPDLRATARRLAAGARRIAPSVRFEERLAATLAERARELQPDGLRPDASDSPLLRLVPALPARQDGPRRPTRLVVGGAITSAAISLAATAYFAWRRSHATGAGSLPAASATTSATTTATSTATAAETF